VAAEVVDRERIVLAAKICESEVEALDYFSHLAATIAEGYRSEIVRE
jgi:hypothetical protein